MTLCDVVGPGMMRRIGASDSMSDTRNREPLTIDKLTFDTNPTFELGKELRAHDFPSDGTCR